MTGNLEKRFWKKVDKCEDGCWLWNASGVSKDGYGHFWIGRGRGKTMAHRMAWELEFGEISSGMQVLHKCDVPRCVRPDHLFLGTASDNMLDMWKKNRHDLKEFWGNNDSSGENNGKSKLVEDDVRMIRQLWSEGYSLVEINEIYSIVEKPAIWKIAHRKTWKHI
jgi:hypothetical protein